MSEQLSYFATFLVYFLIVIILCIMANGYNKKLSDYVLGGRRLNGPITALGAGASDMGGWLLLALPGAAFLYGANQIWMPIGLFIGAYLNWRFISARLRSYTEVANNALTLPAYLDNRFHDRSTLLRALTAVVVLIFFTFYSAAGFVSGAELFQVAFHLNYQTALWVGALIVMTYTAIGGFLAISWIDFFQGSLMFFALIITPIVTYFNLNHTQALTTTFHLINPEYLNPLGNVTLVSVISLLGWGLGYFGQPHILVRFMAVRSVKALPVARRICMVWMGLSLLGAMGAGMIGHAFFVQGIKNPEQIFLHLAHDLFPTLITGLLFSAVLSALMSTASAQLLAAASAVTADLYHRFIHRNASQRELVIMSRACVLVIAFIAVLIALHPNGTILQLVSYAWGGLGAAFGPVIILSLFWRRMTRHGAIAGVIVGSTTVIVWKLLVAPLGGWFAIYEIIPGFALAWIAIVVVSWIGDPPSAAINSEFEQALAESR